VYAFEKSPNAIGVELGPTLGIWLAIVIGLSARANAGCRTISKPEKKRQARPSASKRARALLRARLANGPKRSELVEAAAEAAEIPERLLIDHADHLGVRCRRAEWWPPSY
jgi:hypothetical protein